MAYDQDTAKACLKCGPSCSGFSKHAWRMTCTKCRCAYDEHDVSEFSTQMLLDELELGESPLYKMYIEAQKLAKQCNTHWLPIGLHPAEVDSFLSSLPSSEVPRGDAADRLRRRRLRKQIPPQDRRPAAAVEEAWVHRTSSQLPDASHSLDSELREANRFKNSRNRRDFGIGMVEHMSQSAGQACADCLGTIGFGDFCIRVRPEHRSLEAMTNSPSNEASDLAPAWHVGCFRCATCSEHLVDYCYAWSNGRPYCLRHYGQLIRPRCATCDHLIFSEEYTRAMDQEHHTGHFACRSCDASLTGQRYILRDDEPHCLGCYEAKFANTCEQCKEKIGCDSKDLSFKERHWHEKCFKCSACATSLADRPFATKEEQLYCSDCYDERFAARCDGCQGVFKAGMRKYEYRGQQWHEECFLCVECKQPIGAKSFIPRENQVVCVPCYEAKYAQRCTKCSEVIRRGGVTYKGNPWHKECFTCTNCTKQLAGLKFTSKDEQPYCADCYGELFAKKCTKCTKPITGFGGCKFISFEDRHWHSECFLCGKCNCNLVGRGFLTSDDMIMCSDCGR
ncbi:Four and a half LIM domains protein 2, variant 2 [Clonorchis sinensis]|uniref:Four and a half LIM domains protein 2 n=1 Tax=Clonorchis sinensis TaxID=79923 RepID=A0A8T1M4X0_CLOSI|nr:Four and a half LIM domains protein 2 [Clonorchis sinensis]KAG5444181.1 Four and a half LIM domains protein 2, variant 2 [Clonorchis sinensis]